MIMLAAAASVGVMCIGAVWILFFSSSSQVFGKVLWRIPPKKIIALTFDDGPNDPYTASLLDLLKKHHVRATFFLVGKNVQRFPQTVRRIAAEGHTIGNHSMSHTFSRYFSDRSFQSEIQQAQQAIATITGAPPRFFRAPWLFRTPGILRQVKRQGLTSVWGVFGSEAEVFQRSPHSIARRALRKARPGTIFIFHDGYDAKGGYRGATIGAMNILIPELLARGYSFVTLDDIL